MTSAGVSAMRRLDKLACVGMLTAVLMGQGPIPEADQVHIVTGVLEELDLDKAKGKIRTDLGKPIFFQVVKPELFKQLVVGERITVQLDHQGRAIKVMDVAAPELIKPLSSAE
jgi:hypothetical protein